MECHHFAVKVFKKNGGGKQMTKGVELDRELIFSITCKFHDTGLFYSLSGQ